MSKLSELDLETVATDAKQQNIKYATYEALTGIYKGIAKSTAQRWAKEMRNLPKFADGVWEVGHKTVLVEIEILTKYLDYKRKNLYKPKNKKEVAQ